MVKTNFKRSLLVFLFAGALFPLYSLANDDIQAMNDRIAYLKEEINKLSQQLTEREIYPAEAKDQYGERLNSCTSNIGKIYTTTKRTDGLYANWFNWGGCAGERIYNVPKGGKILVKAYTDSCPDCVCTDPEFCIYEYSGEVWQEYGCIKFPQQKGISRELYIAPQSEKIKITAAGCFYLNLYSAN